MPVAGLWIDSATKLDNFQLVALVIGLLVCGFFIGSGWRAAQRGERGSGFVGNVGEGIVGGAVIGLLVGAVGAFAVGGIEAAVRAIF